MFSAQYFIIANSISFLKQAELHVMVCRNRCLCSRGTLHGGITHQYLLNFKNNPGPKQRQIKKDQVKEHFLIVIIE